MTHQSQLTRSLAPSSRRALTCRSRSALAPDAAWQVESANALYGIFWKQDGKVARAAKTFSSPKYGAYLEASQKQFSFVDISSQTTVDVDGPSPVAQAIRTRTPLRTISCL